MPDASREDVKSSPCTYINDLGRNCLLPLYGDHCSVYALKHEDWWPLQCSPAPFLPLFPFILLSLYCNRQYLGRQCTCEMYAPSDSGCSTGAHYHDSSVSGSGLDVRRGKGAVISILTPAHLLQKSAMHLSQIPKYCHRLPPT